MEQKPLSPNSRLARVQKPSKETRKLLTIFQKLEPQIKATPDLRYAAAVIAEYDDPSNIEKISESQALERIENHAEGLLNDATFMETFQDWSGIAEITRFRKDKKWWKRPTVPRSYRPTWKPRISETSFASSSATGSVLDSTSLDADASQDELETPGPAHRNQAKKGTSVLRPRISMSMTPGTPSRHLEEDSRAASDMLTNSVDLANEDEDELLLLEVPPGLSKQASDEKLPRKRKLQVHRAESSNPSKRSRKLENKPSETTVQFGCGRPPLTTVKVFSQMISTDNRFPPRTTNLSSAAHFLLVHIHVYVPLQKLRKWKLINIIIHIGTRSEMLYKCSKIHLLWGVVLVAKKETDSLDH